jgi:hypothetical protein
MEHRIRRFDDAAAFLDRAEPWLLKAEAEHNLLLGLAHRLKRSAQGFEPRVYLATVEDDGVVGCAFRTPPFKLSRCRRARSASMSPGGRSSPVSSTRTATSARRGGCSRASTSTPGRTSTTSSRCTPATG